MSLQFSNRECGHMETDDAPCRCRVPYPNAVDIAIDSDDLEDMQRRNAASVGLPLDKYLRLSDDAPCNCLKPGWLSRQAEQVAINSATWPQWMRSQSQDSNLSPEQRAKAAKILRDRADELSPCNCHVRQGGQVSPVISTDLTVDEAMWAKWQAGRQKYGEEFVGDPIQELYAEYIDALNYFNEIERRGLLTADLVYARLSTRRLAELVRTEARR